MATSYTYSYSGDFGSSLKSGQLQTEINADGGIAPICTEINRNDDVVDIWFDAALDAGEQTTLNGLVTAHVPEVVIGTAIPQYDALVAADGSGDYTKPSAAFAAGAVTVYVRAGAYVETTDVVIPNNGVMVGETIAPVILYFAALGNGVKVDGSGGTKETAGTISATNGSTAITGSGTTFTNLSAGNFILLGQNFYQIASITDATNLTLSETYRGRSLSGASYMAQAMYSTVNIANMIITGSAGVGLYMRAVRSSTVQYCGLLTNAVGMEIADSAANALTGVNCYDNVTHGLTIKDSYAIGFVNGEAYNNGSDGYHVENSDNVVFNGVLANNNTGNGVMITGTSEKTLINDSTVENNAGDGVYVDTNASNNTINGSTLGNNGGDGVQFNGAKNTVSSCTIMHCGGNGIDVSASVNNKISDNTIDSNSGNAINITGASTMTLITGNQCTNNAIGIDIPATADDCVVNGNIISDNSSHGLQVASDDCIVTGNRCKGNGGDGCVVVTGGTTNTVKNNRFTENTGTDLTDNGTNTIV